MKTIVACDDCLSVVGILNNILSELPMKVPANSEDRLGQKIQIEKRRVFFFYIMVIISILHMFLKAPKTFRDFCQCRSAFSGQPFLFSTMKKKPTTSDKSRGNRV